jgi:hypothetical protein
VPLRKAALGIEDFVPTERAADQTMTIIGSESLALVEAEDTPIAYLPGSAMRVRAKVVGDIPSTRIS